MKITRKNKIDNRKKIKEIQDRHKKYIKKRKIPYIAEEIKLTGHSELNVKQKSDLDKLRKSIDKDARASVKVIRTSKFKQLKNKLNENYSLFVKSASTNRIYKSLIAILMITILMIPLRNMLIKHNEIQRLNSLTCKESSRTLLNIRMNNETNMLEYKISEISIRNSDNKYLVLNGYNWINLDVNTLSDNYTIGDKNYNISKKVDTSSFEITDSSVYIQNSNVENTASKELLFFIKNEDVLNDKSLQKIGSRFWEKSNPIQVKTLAKSYCNSYIMLVETLAGGTLNTKSLQNRIINIEASPMYYSDNTEGIVINLEEMGEIKLSLLDEIKDSPRVLYTKSDGVLRIGNELQNIDYIYISSINNDTLQCYAEDLIATTNDNVFIHKCFDNPDSIGYKTFAIKTDTNLYVIKLNEISHESLLNSIFKQLNIDMEQVQVKKIQSVIPSNKN